MSLEQTACRSHVGRQKPTDIDTEETAGAPKGRWENGGEAAQWGRGSDSGLVVLVTFKRRAELWEGARPLSNQQRELARPRKELGVSEAQTRGLVAKEEVGSGWGQTFCSQPEARGSEFPPGAQGIYWGVTVGEWGTLVCFQSLPTEVGQWVTQERARNRDVRLDGPPGSAGGLGDVGTAGWRGVQRQGRVSEPGLARGGVQAGQESRSPVLGSSRGDREEKPGGWGRAIKTGRLLRQTGPPSGHGSRPLTSWRDWSSQSHRPERGT